MHTTGIQIFHDKKGKPVQALLDLKKYGYVIEDLFDIIEIEKRKNEPVIRAEKLVAKIDRKWAKAK